MLIQIISVLLTGLFVLSSIRAQDNQVKGTFEVGLQFSVLRQSNGSFIFGPNSLPFVVPKMVRSPVGGGGRMVYNLNRLWSVEAELNVFPEQTIFRQHSDVVCCGVGKVIDGLIVEGLAGTKVGLRKPRVGIYGRFRPGFLHFAKTLRDCTLVDVGGFQCNYNKGRTDFVLDVGGSLEAYVSDRWLMRIDLGDTIQFFPGLNPLLRQQVPFRPSETRAQKYHNFQFSLGTGFRF